MKTKKQLIIGLGLVAIVVILSSFIEFTPLINTMIILFFVLLGCWFYYDNAKKNDKTNSNS